MRDNEKQLWDRQPGESSKAYGHFCLYRDAGNERSLRKLAADAKTTSKLRQLQHWSSRWRWVERCEMYDDYLYDQMRRQCERERMDMNKRHAKIAVLGQSILIKGMEELLAKVQTGKQDLTPSDLTRLMHVSTEIERIARGEAADELTGPQGESVIKIQVHYGDDKPGLRPKPREQDGSGVSVRPLYLQP